MLEPLHDWFKRDSCLFPEVYIEVLVESKDVNGLFLASSLWRGRRRIPTFVGPSTSSTRYNKTQLGSTWFQTILFSGLNHKQLTDFGFHLLGEE